MDEPPASQALPSVSPIFLNADGSPLRVYVEATNIQGRPQLVRSLKKYGASICHEPKTAEILLVDAESTQGRMSIRNWGTEADKVVLDYTWANKCINAETALIDNDYGGCLTHDDGLPIGDQDDDGENGAPQKKSKSPLPTPRPTPIEPPTKNHFAQQQQQQPPSQSARRSQSRAASAFEADSHRGSAPPATFPIVPNMQGGVFPGGINPLLGAPGGTPVLPPMSAQQQMTQYLLTQQLLLQQMAAQTGQQFNPQQPLAMTDPLWLSMQDNIFRTMMQSQQMAQIQQTAAFPQFQQQQQQPVVTASPVEEQALPFPTVPHSKKSRHSMQMDTDERSPSPPPLSANRADKGKKKLKQRAVSPPPKRRKTSGSTFEQGSSSRPAQSSSISAPLPDTTRKLFALRSGRAVKFYVQIGGHNRFNLVRSIKQNGGLIVNSVEDANYVVLFPGVKTDKAHDVYCRQAATAGVPVVTPKFVNECIEEGILLDTEEYLFEPIKKTRKRTLSDAAMEARNRSPIEPESEDDDEDTASPPVSTPQITMKSRPVVHSTPSSVTVKPKSLYDTEKKRERADKPDSEKKRKISSSLSTQAILMAARDSQLGKSTASQHREKKTNGASANTKTARPRDPPSPIPPPESSRVMHGGKGFRYPKEEIDFALEYARVMFERDHQASMNEITLAIHRKLSHHTLASWRTHLGSPAFTPQFDELRKRAGIAFRKAQNAKQNLQPAASVDEPATPMAQFSQEDEPPASPSPTPLLQDDLEEDLNTIAKFFADGNDDQTEEEEVIWARLTNQAPCKTKARWDDFYQTNSDEVQRRYQILLDAREAGN